MRGLSLFLLLVARLAPEQGLTNLDRIAPFWPPGDCAQSPEPVSFEIPRSMFEGRERKQFVRVTVECGRNCMPLPSFGSASETGHVVALAPARGGSQLGVIVCENGL